MGHWDLSLFENDAAADTVAAIEAGEITVNDIVERITGPTSELDVDEASTMLVLCEIVATWLGAPGQATPEPIREWCEASRPKQPERLREPAREKLAAVCSDSELLALWREQGVLLRALRAPCELDARLSGETLEEHDASPAAALRHWTPTERTAIRLMAFPAVSVASGVWGAGVMQCELALDIETMFHAALRECETQAEATAQITELNTRLLETEEAGLFWIALAWVQHRLGRLEEEVRERARCFAENEDPAYWGPLADARAKEMKKFLRALDRPLKPRGVPRATKLPFTAGDVLRFRSTRISDGVCYARVITDDRALLAFYRNRSGLSVPNSIRTWRPSRSNRLNRAETARREFDPWEVTLLDVGLVATCYDGFVRGRFRRIANLPLERRFHDFIPAVAEYGSHPTKRSVSDARGGDGESKKVMPISDVPLFAITDRRDQQLEEVLERLGE